MFTICLFYLLLGMMEQRSRGFEHISLSTLSEEELRYWQLCIQYFSNHPDAESDLYTIRNQKTRKFKKNRDTPNERESD
jgi:hypothetical protein